jgi:hypothetical protein
MITGSARLYAARADAPLAAAAPARFVLVATLGRG